MERGQPVNSWPFIQEVVVSTHKQLLKGRVTVKINRCIVAVATAALVTFGAGMAAATDLAPSAAPKGTHKAGGHKHPVPVKAPYVYTPPACTLLTCLTPVNTGP
jgi:hypothetical protein